MPPARNSQCHRRFPPEILTNDEVCRLLDGCSLRAPTGVRNRALIAILYRGGLRINEALGLFPKDIDLEAGSIRILNGKGGRARTRQEPPLTPPSAFGDNADWQETGSVPCR